MKIKFILLIFVAVIVSFSCNQPTVSTETPKTQRDTLTSDFIFTKSSDSIIQNGEYIKYYKNGVMEMRGMMKKGKRNGIWRSWYEDGSPWSETTFAEGKKNGKTTTWYDNEKKRYEGFYKDDEESGKWTFWDETGKQQYSKEYK